MMFEKIKSEIMLTNNGKLMIACLPSELKAAVPALVESGKVVYATFMVKGDSVRVKGS